MTKILDGRKAAEHILNSIAKEAMGAKLIVILVGEDPASEVYVANKEKAALKIGMKSEVLKFAASTSEERLIEEIEKLNADKSVNGIIVQMPLPPHLHAGRIIKHISPLKDVDGFHAYNVGKMTLGAEFETLAPCTPKGIVRLLEYYKINTAGAHVVVLGRSNTVGKAIGIMLLNRDATITICHSKTKDLESHTKMADIIILAIGKAKFLKANMVKKEAIIIDVGIHRNKSGLCGDADFEDLLGNVQAISPVPGGIGPMTVACLLENTVIARQAQIKSLS